MFGRNLLNLYECSFFLKSLVQVKTMNHMRKQRRVILTMKWKIALITLVIAIIASIALVYLLAQWEKASHFQWINHSFVEIDKVTVVSWVIDGDTFETTSGDRIRLADIDAPEEGESGYFEARDLLVELVYDKTVYLDIDDIYRTDKYDRLVCVVYADRNSTHLFNVNKALVDLYFAVVQDYDNEFDPYAWSLIVQKETNP